MKDKSFSVEYIEKKIRKKSFGILSTVSPKGWSQSSGVMYGSSTSSEPLKLYIITDKKYKKTQNIINNSHVSFVITFPRYYIRFAPASTIQFQATAKILPMTDKTALEIFKKKRILRDLTDFTDDDYIKDEFVFIELSPVKRYNCYGVGYSILELARNTEEATYQVEIP